MRNPRAYGRPRATLIATLLLLTLAVAAVLAYQAYLSTVSHAAVAEQVLADYAEYAASKFSSIARKNLEVLIARRLSPFACVDQLPFTLRAAEPERKRHQAKASATDKHASAILSEEDLRKAAAILSGFGSCGCEAPLVFFNYFRADSTAEWLVTDGKPFDWAIQKKLIEAIQVFGRSERSLFREVSPPALTAIGTGYGKVRVFAFVVQRFGSPGAERAWGFEIDNDSLTALFDLIVEKEALLPPALVKKMPGARMVNVSVKDTQGHFLYHPLRGKVRFAQSMPIDTQPSQLVAIAHLAPEAAARLVIGGLPRARLPLLAGLLALTTTLVLVALVQLRREYELVRLRGDFVSSVSHELRTPLAQIRLFIETLRLGRVRSEEEGRRALEIIDQESKRLAQLVENVLLFSRSERRVVKLRPEPTEVAPLVREVIEGFAPLARPKQVTIPVAVGEGAESLVVKLDRGALRQMLLNLLDNAVKYGPAGQAVTVGVDRVADRLHLSVRDAGPGIPPKYRERIWEPFCRLDRERESAVAGAGIGLAVVRELAVQHGGHAWVDTAPGGGARFVIELPGIECGAVAEAGAIVDGEAARA